MIDSAQPATAARGGGLRCANPPYGLWRSNQDVDGRDKPGHDSGEMVSTRAESATDTVAAGLTPGRNRPRSSEPSVVRRACSVRRREVSLRLEAPEVGVERRIERGEVRFLNLIQERVRGDRSVAWIQDGRADDPDGSSIGTIDSLLPFGAAPVGFEVDVQLIGRLDDRRSVQAKSILGPQPRKYGPAFVAGMGGIDREPEVGDDPHPQDVVAEIPERAVMCLRSGAKGIIAVAAVDGVAIGGESPILPELWSGDS